jgi:hypothetical protein
MGRKICLTRYGRSVDIETKTPAERWIGSTVRNARITEREAAELHTRIEWIADQLGYTVGSMEVIVDLIRLNGFSIHEAIDRAAAAARGETV